MARAFAWALCLSVAAAQAEEPPREVTLGEAFRLTVGETARVASEGVQVGFERVVNDSRCPKGEQCIREGEAIVRVWLQKDDSRITLELRTSPQEAQVGGALGYEVRLRQLDPYPGSRRGQDPVPWVATLDLARGSGRPAESR